MNNLALVKLRVWLFDGREQIIEARTYGEAFDKAAEIGAWRAVDGFGEIYRRMEGDWVGMLNTREYTRERAGAKRGNKACCRLTLQRS